MDVTRRDNEMSLHSMLIGFLVLLGIFGQILLSQWSLLLFLATSLLGFAIILIVISYKISDSGWNSYDKEEELDKELEEAKELEEILKKEKPGIGLTRNPGIVTCEIYEQQKKRKRCEKVNDKLIWGSTFIIIVSIILYIISLGVL